MATTEKPEQGIANGAAVAAFLGAAIGAFAMGLIVILNEADVFAAPSLYGPAGGLSGRTTIAVAIWLIAWGVLHQRWKARQMAPGQVITVSLVLIALGVLLAFPPIWGLL